MGVERAGEEDVRITRKGRPEEKVLAERGEGGLVHVEILLGGRGGLENKMCFRQVFEKRVSEINSSGIVEIKHKEGNSPAYAPSVKKEPENDNFGPIQSACDGHIPGSAVLSWVCSS